MSGYTGKKFLKRNIQRETERKRETWDGVIYDVLPLERTCRVKIQGSDKPIPARYPENWVKTPEWLKQGNPVRIRHTGGIRGYIEVVGHGLTLPTGITLLPLPGDPDVVLQKARLMACDVPRMAVLVRVGTYRIGGVEYVLDYITMVADSTYQMSDGGRMGDIAAIVEIDDAPAEGSSRIDLVSVGVDGIVDYTKGTETTGTPVKPTVASGHVELGTVYVEGGDLQIEQSDIGKLPYTVPPAPGAPPVGPYIERAWNVNWYGPSGDYGVINGYTIGTGATIRYVIPQNRSDIGRVDWYIMSDGFEGDVTFICPARETYTQSIHYEVAAKLLLRSQLYVWNYANIPYDYVPQGFYECIVHATLGGLISAQTGRQTVSGEYV